MHMDAWKSIQFTGMLTGTFSTSELLVQTSNDNVNWVTVGSAVTTNSMVQLVNVSAFLRIYSTTATATATAVLVGHSHAT